MKQSVRIIVVAVTLLAVLCLSGVVMASAVGSVVLPPKAIVGGKDLGDWLSEYWRVQYSAGITEPYDAGPIILVPMPNGALVAGDGSPESPAHWKGEISLELRRGDTFILPVFAWLGECYLAGPNDPVIPEDKVRSTITDQVVTIDGKPVMKRFWDYYTPPIAFDPTIWYAEPSSYGSTGIVYFQGAGLMARFETAGWHTIQLFEKMIIPSSLYEGAPNLGSIYDNTWHIYVSARKEK